MVTSFIYCYEYTVLSIMFEIDILFPTRFYSDVMVLDQMEQLETYIIDDLFSILTYITLKIKR